MKKILAFVLAMIMTFSMAVLPVGASVEGNIEDAENLYDSASSDISGVIDSAEDVYNDFQTEDYGSAVMDTLTLLENLFRAIHGIVHGFSEIFDFDCPFCGGDYDYVRPERPEKPEEEDTTATPEEDTTATPEEDTTAAPEENTTAAPEEDTTAAPEEDTTVAPEETTTVAPEETTTEAPEETTTEAPEETTTEAPEETTTEAPEETTTEAPEETTTEAPEETTTEAPELAEYYVIVKNSDIAADYNYNYVNNQLYAMYAKVGIKFWNRYYVANKVTIKNMATAYVETAILIDEESAGVKQISFEGSNHFHGNGGNFKLIVNNSDTTVKVKLNDNTRVGSVYLTKDNVGDYIVGPYTVVA